MRNSQRLPCETESRRPVNRVLMKKSLLMIRDRLIIRLCGVVTDRFRWSRYFCKAILGADRIGLMFHPQGVCKRQVGCYVPLILAIARQSVVSEAQCSM